MPNTTPLVTRLIAAALPFMAYLPALELSNNVACADPEAEDMGGHILIMIRHRMVEFGVQCGDAKTCARVMARAWTKWHVANPGRVAA